MGTAYEQAGLHEQAAEEYRRALALCPTYVDIRTRLGVSLRAAGNLPAAEREFAKAKKEHPDLVGPRLQLGMTYYTSGRRNDAAREWREVLAMEPENKFAKLYLRLVSDGKAKRSLSSLGTIESPPNPLQKVRLGVIPFFSQTFFVDEIPAYLPCGEGSHTYLHIEKQGPDHQRGGQAAGPPAGGPGTRRGLRGAERSARHHSAMD